jgi:hypothetical protein
VDTSNCRAITFFSNFVLTGVSKLLMKNREESKNLLLQDQTFLSQVLRKSIRQNYFLMLQYLIDELEVDINQKLGNANGKSTTFLIEAMDAEFER